MEKKLNTITYYDNVAGLRAFASIGIVMMHVLSNGGYALEGFLFKEWIPSFTDLVFLFMMISSFSMCCGYYEKMLSGKMDLVKFYQKRFSKVWPFFALLTVFDILISPSMDAFFEGFANLTLCFGLLPNARISVIGVGWTLGVIFVFYLLFPFFCFLMSDVRRRWLTMAAAILLNFACRYYFFDAVHVVSDFSSRSNFVYCAVYFIAGGMVWHYKELLDRVFGRWLCPVAMTVVVLSTIVYFKIAKTTAVMLTMYSALLLYAIGRKDSKGLVNNSVVRFISTLSMEIYLCHMVVYRIIEKMGFVRIFHNECLSYFMTVVTTIVGSIIFSLCAKQILEKMNMILSKRYTPITK